MLAFFRFLIDNVRQYDSFNPNMSTLIRRRAADTVTVPHARRCIHQVLQRFLCLCEVYADRAVAAFVVGDTAAPATTRPTPAAVPIVKNRHLLVSAH